MDTEIYKKTQFGERLVGIINDGILYTVDGTKRKVSGRIDKTNVVYRQTSHSEQELGRCTTEGEVISNGLFEGGPMGWLDDDGTVIQGGLIFGEEEVGRVQGPEQHGGAAALLLHLLPAEAEEERRSKR